MLYIVAIGWLALLGSVISSHGVLAQSQPEPTLEQTLNWLQENISSAGLTNLSKGKHGDEEVWYMDSSVWSPLAVNSCNIGLRQRLVNETRFPDGSRISSESRRDFRVPLGWLHSSTIASAPLADAVGPMFHYPSASVGVLRMEFSRPVQIDVLVTTQVLRGPPTNVNETFTMKSVTIAGSDREFLRSLQLALDHAKKFCAAKELFVPKP